MKADFEEKFLGSLEEDFFAKRILLAVSGGADSVALLLCICALREQTGISPVVATVNHRIRPESESGGDCDFVLSLCQKLGVECRVIEAEANQISKIADQRGKGIEEAARFFRYNALKETCRNANCYAIFLAHNKNDQEETLLQRFLQGSFKESSCGIPSRREEDACIFFRPMLSISRSEILDYLKEKKCAYRTDNTNFDSSYFRNRIRNVLVPTLNKNFPGWNTAVLSAANKKKIDEDYFDSVLNSYEWHSSVKEKEIFEHSFFMEQNLFDSLHLSLKIRLIYRALEKLECEFRISYENIKKFCLGKNLSTCDVKMERADGKVFVSKIKNQLKNSGKNTVLFAIIEEEGDFFVGNYRISVTKIGDDEKICQSDKKMKKSYLPFSLEMIDGKLKIDAMQHGSRAVRVCILEGYERV